MSNPLLKLAIDNEPRRSGLARYDAARHALAEATRVDEVKTVRDKAMAMQLYAKQAKDRELIDYATEIRIRAEIRAGELLAEMADTGKRAVSGDKESGRSKKPLSKPTLSDLGVTKSQSSRWQGLAGLSADEQEAKIEHAKRLAVMAVEGNKPFGRGPGGSDEWFTPLVYIEAARAVLGGIDLDPASCHFAQSQTIHARKFFSKHDDGLRQNWNGKVWLNPPFSRVAEFVTKLLDEIKAGRVTAAILLVNDCTDAAWFHEAARACAAMCFTRGRIRFEQADGSVGAPPQGQAIFYYGSNIASFKKIFGAFGFVAVPA